MQKILNFSENISKYLIAAVLVIVPLLPKFPFIRVPGTYVSIRFEDLLMLLLGILLIPKILSDFQVVKRDKIVQAILIFLGVGLISIFAGILITDTVDPGLGILHWARRIEYILPFLATYLLIPRNRVKESVRFYFKIIVIVIFIAFIYGIGQRYFKFPVIITQNEEYSKGIALRWTPGAHINSTFAGHYDLSAFIVLTLPILIAGIFIFRDKFRKIPLIFASGAGLWLLINSISRTAQVSYLLAVSIALLLLKKTKGWLFVVLISIVFMFMSSGLDVRFTRAIKVLYEHITTGKSFGYVTDFVVRAEGNIPVSGDVLPTPTTKPAVTNNEIKDVSISIRYNVEWPRALRAFIKNPILGTGYSSIGLATDNDYLRMLGEIGLLGFFAFFLIILRIAKVFLRVFSIRDRLDFVEKSFIFGTIGGVIGIFATAFLIDLFEASKLAIIFWLLIGCSVRLIQNRLNEGKN